MKTNWKPLVKILSISGIFFLIFVIGSYSLFKKEMMTSSPAKNKLLFKTSDAVGLVELNGVIMDSKKMLKTIEKFQEDPRVKAIVVRINSPGGAVAPSQEIYQALKNSSKPVVASMSSVAASGGYYIAMGAKKVFANAGTITGSIGVIMEFANLEKLYEWAKIKRYVIKTGKFKDSGADYREMSEEERGQLQAMVDDVLLQFKSAVADGRQMTMDEVTSVADGRIFSGAQAKEAGLVDEIGSLNDAINEAGKMAGITGKPKVLRDEKKKGFLEYFQDSLSDSEEEESRYAGTGFLQQFARWMGVRHLPGSESITGNLAPGVYWIWKGAL